MTAPTCIAPPPREPIPLGGTAPQFSTADKTETQRPFPLLYFTVLCCILLVFGSAQEQQVKVQVLRDKYIILLTYLT